LGIPLPVILILDAPVSANVLGDLLGAMFERIKAGDEVTHSAAALRLSTGGFLTSARDADDGLGKRQANGFGFHRHDPYFVMG
jgi:hypothetical protein